MTREPKTPAGGAGSGANKAGAQTKSSIEKDRDTSHIANDDKGRDKDGEKSGKIKGSGDLGKVMSQPPEHAKDTTVHDGDRFMCIDDSSRVQLVAPSPRTDGGNIHEDEFLKGPELSAKELSEEKQTFDNTMQWAEWAAAGLAGVDLPAGMMALGLLLRTRQAQDAKFDKAIQSQKSLRCSPPSTQRDPLRQ